MSIKGFKIDGVVQKYDYNALDNIPISAIDLPILKENALSLNNGNLLDIGDSEFLRNSGTHVQNGVTWKYNGAGIEAKGTLSGSVSNLNIWSSSISLPDWMEIGKRYIVYIESSEHLVLRIFFYKSGVLGTADVQTYEPFCFTVPSDATGVIIRLSCITNGHQYDEIVYPKIVRMENILDFHRHTFEYFNGIDGKIALNPDDFTRGTINSSGANGPLAANVRLRNILPWTVPYNMTLVATDPKYRVFVNYYNDDGSHSQSDWYSNGICKFKAGEIVRITLDAANTGVNYIEKDEMLSHFYFIKDPSIVRGNSIISRNPEAESRLIALKRHTNINSATLPSGIIQTHNNNFAIAHISDIHEDVTRFNSFIDFCDYYRPYIDARICTGDYVSSPVVDEINAIKDVDSNREVMFCIGNHERGGFNATSMSLDEIVNAWGLDNYSVTTPPTGLSNPGGVYYYYNDFIRTATLANGIDGYKIRVIVLNNCDNPSNSAVNQYSQAQINWLIDVLKDSANNQFAVIIGTHYGESDILPNNKGFYFRYAGPFGERADIPVVENIIDAFRKKENYQATGIRERVNQSVTLTVNADFTNCDYNGIFLAYMTGHWHHDQIGYSANHPDQLYLGIACGTCKEGSDRSKYGDIPRVNGTKSEDAFNIYSFDLINNQCKVMRIGSDMNDEMIPRQYACFDIQPTIS